jgi:hypothetical protein
VGPLAPTMAWDRWGRLGRLAGWAGRTRMMKPGCPKTRHVQIAIESVAWWSDG